MVSLLLISICFTSCKKETEDPIKFKTGAFPDSVFNVLAINSQYDDYNLDLPQLLGNSPIIFSSNRKSAGGQFDLEQADIRFNFIQTNGDFFLNAAMTTDAFLTSLIQKTVTPLNDFGPYRFYSAIDGYEYMIISSVNALGNLDLFYLKNRPVFGTSLPEVTGPFPVNLFNTVSDDAYFCLDSNQDSAYFTTNRDGNFDIMVHKKPVESEFSTWMNQGLMSSVKPDSINSAADDKCPQILKKIMIFTSNRPGGSGGYDLYYSVFRKGKWSSPVNLGPGINTESDEYRPVLGHHPDFDNCFLMFSSNRPGGKGGFDLYFTGISLPEK